MLRAIKHLIISALVITPLLFTTYPDKLANYLFDKDPPYVEILAPEGIVRGKVEIKVTAFDRSEPLGFSVNIGGVEWTPLLPLNIDTTRLPDGHTTLRIEVEDYSLRKNKTIKEVEINIDNTPPVVELIIEHQVMEPGGLMWGWVKTNEPVNSISGEIDKADLSLLKFFNEDYRYFFIIGFPPHKYDPKHDFTVTVVDEAGNRGYFTRELHFVKRSFPRERIKLPESKIPLLDRELLRREKEIINKVVEVIDEDIFWEGAFYRPVDGEITSPFGALRVFNGGLFYDQHRGVDYHGEIGTAIRATNTGYVALAEELKVRGGTVIINHGIGVMSLYYHLDRIKVQRGDKVDKGQVIGTVGDTGLTTAPHLHFEMRIRNVAVDPSHFYGGK